MSWPPRWLNQELPVHQENDKPTAIDVLTTIQTRHKVWSVDTKEAIGYQMRDVSLISAAYSGKPDFGIKLGNCRELALQPGRYVRITIEVLKTEKEVRDAIDEQQTASLHGSDSPQSVLR